MRSRITISLALVALIALPLSGSDDPHGQAFNVQCTNSCHNLHTAAGGSLTIAAGNENVCFSCHNITGGTATNFLIDPASKADLTTRKGKSHAWNATAANVNAGAGTPSWNQMQVRLDTGKIICSTCHNQHSSNTEAVTSGQAGTQFKSSVDQIFGTGATLAFTATATAAQNSYIVEIVTGGGTGAATFRYSKDGEISWFGTQSTGANVSLDADVSVQFSGTYTAADKFLFYVGYPFLRLNKAGGYALDDGPTGGGDKFCRICHADWVMDHNAVDTWTGAYRSHPTGVALDANGGGYDRAAPLDGDGGAAGSDGNPTNDLRLDSGGRVQCLTCHGVHHADGNTQTVDVP